jgi:hypothetical protein
MTPTGGARLCVQDDRGSRRCLQDDAPGDDERGAEGVGAGGKDNVANRRVGKCTGQAGDGAHLGLQLTAVTGHKGRRSDAAHDRPGTHDRCGVRELSPIMLAVREDSSQLANGVCFFCPQILACMHAGLIGFRIERS